MFRRARGDQRGVTLIECLVAIVILSISVAGIAGASIAASRGSSASNRSERLDVLLAEFNIELVQQQKIATVEQLAQAN